MITARGTVPYPPNADARPIQRLAGDLARLGQGMQESAAGLTATSSAAQSSWVGQAADAFASHVQQRAESVSQVGQTLAGAVPVLTTFAAAITTTQAAYSTAAQAEMAARAGLPFTSAALAAALAAEAAAVAALQGAGLACAGGLLAIEIELAAVQFFGVSRETFASLKATATQIWEGIEELGEEFDPDAAVKLLNTTITIPRSDGSSTRTSVLGWLIGRNDHVNVAAGVLQSVFGVGALLSAPPLAAVDRPELVAQVAPGGVGPITPLQIGEIPAMLESLRRAPGAEVDQSVSILTTRGTAPDGSTVLNVYVPGMVPPGPNSTFGRSGTRNLVNAATDHITGMSTETLALRRWLDAQGLRRGDTVNFFAHSQGGIVARNVANDIVGDGYRTNVVSYGSPDGQFRPGVGSYQVQNLRDPVPNARVGGDGQVTTALYPGQRLITFDRESVGSQEDDLFAAHDARMYGDQMQHGPATPGVAELRAFLAGQQQVRIDPSRTTVVTFEGPCTPDGVCDAVPVPSSGYQIRP